jgi:hypothetical protein
VAIPEDSPQVSQSVEDSVSFFLYDGPLELSGSKRFAKEGNWLLNVVNKLETVCTYTIVRAISLKENRAVHSWKEHSVILFYFFDDLIESNYAFFSPD